MGCIFCSTILVKLMYSNFNSGGKFTVWLSSISGLLMFDSIARRFLGSLSGEVLCLLLFFSPVSTDNGELLTGVALCMKFVMPS